MLNPELPSRTDHAGALAMALACALALVWLQASFEGMLDGDSYFHTRAAQQWMEHGVSKTFPQAAFSTWSDHYADKDFLFHVLLAPFCADEAALAAGGKRAAALFGFLFFSSFALAIRSLDIRFGALWIALLIITNAWWIEHMLVVRPHLLAITLLPMEIICLLRGRWKTLGGLSALHVWGHSSYVLLPAFPIALLLAHVIRGERGPWRPLIGVAGGIAVGVLLHPYFPNNFALSYDQVVEVARSVWGERPDIPLDLFGSELIGQSFTRVRPIAHGWLPAAAGLAIWFTERSPRTLGVEALTLALLTLGCLVLTSLSPRFLAFLLPVSILLAGRVWTELASGRSVKSLLRLPERKGRALVCALIGVVIVDQAAVQITEARDFATHARIAEVYAPAIAWLDEQAEPSDGVYHGFWWAFAWLYHFRPEGRYVEGLDPIFLYRFDSGLFEKALRLYRGQSEDVWQTLAEDFDADWVFVAKLDRTRAMRWSLAQEPRLRRVYADAYALVYRVVRPPRAVGSHGRVQ